MTTKTILTMAIIAVLPFGAWADYTFVEQNTPARVANNGTAALAANDGPFQTVDTQPADESHIATTAYVKGAYNDTIAAVNSVWRLEDMYYDELWSRMDNIVDEDISSVNERIDTAYDEINGVYDDLAEAIDHKQGKLYGVTSNTDIDTDVIDGDNFVAAMYNGFYGGGSLSDAGVPDNGENHLITADAVAYGMRLFVGGYLGEHPITVYTTWDSDATTPVALSSLGQ